MSVLDDRLAYYTYKLDEINKINVRINATNIIKESYNRYYVILNNDDMMSDIFREICKKICLKRSMFGYTVSLSVLLNNYAVSLNTVLDSNMLPVECYVCIFFGLVLSIAVDGDIDDDITEKTIHELLDTVNGKTRGVWFNENEVNCKKAIKEASLLVSSNVNCFGEIDSNLFHKAECNILSVLRDKFSAMEFVSDINMVFLDAASMSNQLSNCGVTIEQLDNKFILIYNQSAVSTTGMIETYQELKNVVLNELDIPSELIDTVGQDCKYNKNSDNVRALLTSDVVFSKSIYTIIVWYLKDGVDIAQERIIEDFILQALFYIKLSLQLDDMSSNMLLPYYSGSSKELDYTSSVIDWKDLQVQYSP